MPRGRPKEIPEYCVRCTSINQVARACGVSTVTVDHWLREGHVQRRSIGRRSYEYDLGQAIRHAHGEHLRREHSKQVKELESQIEGLRETLSSNSDPEADSELEVLKIAKLRLELKHKQYDLAQRRQDLIPRCHVGEYLEHMMGHLRRAGDLLRRHHGNDAQKVLNDAIDASVRGIDKLFETIEKNADKRSKKGRLVKDENDTSTPGSKKAKRKGTGEDVP